MPDAYGHSDTEPGEQRQLGWQNVLLIAFGLT